jgi:3-hydroxyacyl-[acyl-carrier-protein] dehydratase
MQFRLLDRITELEPGKRITAEKKLTGDEQYLKDHFPLFPVMPGVLMLEAMFQASMWLVRRTDDFHYALVLLKEARNIKYADFITPGKTLIVQSEILKREGEIYTLKAQGTVDGEMAVNARLLLERGHISARLPRRPQSDPYTRKKMKEFFDELYQPTAVAHAP